MEKTMTLNLRVNPTVKQQAEDVLKQLGIPMATAIDMYLRLITMTGTARSSSASTRHCRPAWNSMSTLRCVCLRNSPEVSSHRVIAAPNQMR